MPDYHENNRDMPELIGFALGDCVVDIEERAAKYLRVVHRTALELAVQNQFGAEIGGFWLMAEQIDQLRRLADYYPASESALVKRTVEAYLQAQLSDFRLTVSASISDNRGL